MSNLTNKITSRRIDTPNGDLKIVNAARVSFAKENAELVPADAGLIDYLASHRHWTPFSHCRDSFEFGTWNIEESLDLMRFFTYTLTLEDKASMVIKYIGNGVTVVRTSLFGWASILNRYSQQDDEIEYQIHHQMAGIYNYLMAAYPLSTEKLFSAGTHLIFGQFVHSAEPYITDADGDLMDITLCEYVPIFIARQRFKHMVGTTYNEVSRRYVSTTPQVYVPDVWRGKHENKKQGSTDEPSEYMHRMFGAAPAVAAELERVIMSYENMIKNGVCPEQARLILPQGMMTEYYVTASVTAHKRFLEQRLDPHAQLEIQELAKLNEKLIKE